MVNDYADDLLVSVQSNTMSAADLSKLSALVNATNALAQQLTSQITTTAPILTNVRQAVPSLAKQTDKTLRGDCQQLFT